MLPPMRSASLSRPTPVCTGTPRAGAGHNLHRPYASLPYPGRTSKALWTSSCVSADAPKKSEPCHATCPRGGIWCNASRPLRHGRRRLRNTSSGRRSGQSSWRAVRPTPRSVGHASGWPIHAHNLPAHACDASFLRASAEDAFHVGVGVPEMSGLCADACGCHKDHMSTMLFCTHQCTSTNPFTSTDAHTCTLPHHIDFCIHTHTQLTCTRACIPSEKTSGMTLQLKAILGGGNSNTLSSWLHLDCAGSHPGSHWAPACKPSDAWNHRELLEATLRASGSHPERRWKPLEAWEAILCCRGKPSWMPYEAS
jgi:hypothetical protein